MTPINALIRRKEQHSVSNVPYSSDDLIELLTSIFVLRLRTFDISAEVCGNSRIRDKPTSLISILLRRKELVNEYI